MKNFITTLFLLFIGLTALSQNPSKIIESFNKAQTYTSEGKFDLALIEYKRAYEYGDKVQSPFQLGELYYSGLGTQKNVPEAFKWYKISADNGNPQGAYFVAYSYHNGEGTVQDYSKAIEYYYKASDIVPNANLSLGLLIREGLGEMKNEEKAYKYIKKGAEMGSPDAQFVLAHGYLMGYGRLPKNRQLAIDWMKKSAEQGNINAIIWLNDNK